MYCTAISFIQHDVILQMMLISARDEFKIKYEQMERDVLLLNERVWYICLSLF